MLRARETVESERTESKALYQQRQHQCHAPSAVARGGAAPGDAVVVCDEVVLGGVMIVCDEVVLGNVMIVCDEVVLGGVMVVCDEIVLTDAVVVIE